MFLTHIKAGADDRSPYGGFWFKPVNHGGVGGPVTIDRAMQLPVVLACVRVLAESFSVLPLKIYKRDGTKRTLVTKHWLYDLIGRHPNPFQTAFEWREMMQGHLALRGNAYNQIISDRRGNITAFMPMHRYAQRCGFLVGLGMGHDSLQHRHAALQANEIFADAAGNQARVRAAVLPIDHRLDRPQRGAERAAGLQPVEQLHRAVPELPR